MALQRSGATRRGVLAASSIEAAHAALRREELVPTRIRPHRRWVAFARRMPQADLAIGLRALADALRTGLPIGRALELMEDVAPPSWKGVLPSVRESVRVGQPLSAALSLPSMGVPPMVLSLAAAGESSGTLGDALQRAAEFCEERAQLESELSQALTYPIIIAVAGVLSVWLMLAVVVPRFAVILADLGQTLPPSTRAVLAAADVLRVASFVAVPFTALAIATTARLRRTDSGRRQIDALLRSIPWLGSVREMTSASRLADSLALLLDAGVPIRRSLALAAAATGDAETGARARAASEALRSGRAISETLYEHGVVTDVIVRLVRSGELSGELSAALRHGARLERDRAHRRIRVAVRALEPALILLFAGVVGVVAVAMLQAVYAIRPI